MMVIGWFISRCRRKGMLLVQFPVALQVIEENASFCENKSVALAL